MTGAERMAELYRRLEDLGFDSSFVRGRVLPEWWRDDLASNPTAYAHGAGMIAKFLGLDVRTLLADDVPVLYRVNSSATVLTGLRDRNGTVIGDGVSVPEPETPRRKVVSLLCPMHAVRLAEEHHEALSKPSTPESDERARRARWELAHEVWRECAACQALFAQAREKTAPSTEGSDAVTPGGV